MVTLDAADQAPAGALHEEKSLRLGSVHGVLVRRVPLDRASRPLGLTALLWLVMVLALLGAPPTRSFAIGPLCCADIHSDVPHRHAGAASASEVAAPKPRLATMALGPEVGGAMHVTMPAPPTSVDVAPPDHPPR